MNSVSNSKPPRLARGLMGAILLAGLLLYGHPAVATPTTPTSDFIDNNDPYNIAESA